MVASRPQPEWDDEQRGWMLALADVEAGECPSCHGDREETMDPATEGRWQPHDGTCYRCFAINAHAERRRDSSYAGALLFGARLRD